MENEYLNYLLKVSVSLGVFSLIYLCLFRSDTLSWLRRFLLLFILLFSAIYPFCQFGIAPDNTSRVYQGWLSQIVVNASPSGEEVPSLNSIGISEVLLIVMLIGSLFLLFRFFTQIFGIVHLVRSGKITKKDNYTLISISENITPFSFFNFLFISDQKTTQADLDLMIKHEVAHAKQYHSIDVLISELFCIVFWWNPVVWLLRREIKVNLEYLADTSVIDTGADVREYQYLLLKTIKNNASIYIINEFNVSQLKKRITMINKCTTSKFVSIKYLLLIPLMGVLLIANTDAKESVDVQATLISNDNLVQDDEKIYKVIDKMPIYPGGVDEMMKFIGQNLKYPSSAIKDNVEGRIVLRFVVSKTGKVSDVEVIRSLSEDCDAEAVRVVNMMPDWTPGEQGGKKVSVYYTLPIQYALQKKTAK
ncbi:M56 family metallopeptidase [Dysgonomonas macrotermitis]|uniref:TonB family C-terminal domain-containing protein n=1 Tax=Dysgonomonas macrotermitis TaxID=1346286 RepID=A0A1M5BAI1_9BACT|nr:M56 family metallopeptidase [Dysgonomonas macrotermitis]SHF39435.1 TonB family C-terminal domain-containing protein [Dysgonomonas macrotermitis]